MSGKGEGKRHNREAQSEQHGFQKAPKEHIGERNFENSIDEAEASDKEEVLEKMRLLEEKRRQDEAEKAESGS